jgi:hypothetical protein
VEPEFSDEGDIFSLRYLGKRFSVVKKAAVPKNALCFSYKN